jgi:hypothetical protein
MVESQVQSYDMVEETSAGRKSEAGSLAQTPEFWHGVESQATADWQKSPE